MIVALDLLQNGESDGRWDKISHPSEHPWYANGTYDGDDGILKKALEIAYHEGRASLIDDINKDYNQAIQCCVDSERVVSKYQSA